MSVTPTHVPDKSNAEASDLWSNNLLLFYVYCPLFGPFFGLKNASQLFKKKLDPVLHYACCITPMRVMSFRDNLCGIVFADNAAFFEKILQRCRAVDNNVSDLTGSRFELQTFRSRKELQTYRSINWQVFSR